MNEVSLCLIRKKKHCPGNQKYYNLHTKDYSNSYADHTMDAFQYWVLDNRQKLGLRWSYDIGRYIKEWGYVYNNEHNLYFNTWKNWYAGYDKTFHTRSIKDTRGVSQKIRILGCNLAKAVEDLGKIIWAEGCTINTTPEFNVDEIFK